MSDVTVVGNVMSMNPPVSVSSVNTPPDPNAVALVPETVNSNSSPKPASDVSFFILRVPVAESVNVHTTFSFGATFTIMPLSVVVAATALLVHVTLERFHPLGVSLSIIV